MKLFPIRPPLRIGWRGRSGVLGMPGNDRGTSGSGMVEAGAARRLHASVRDVARLAGVSATTVSRALRGNSYVAAATRDRVFRAASQLAYSLPQRPHRPTLVVVLVRSPARWFYSEAISGIERVLVGTDHRLVLHS